MDRGFGRAVTWDIPLLDGYDYEFVPSRARQSGPGTMRGLNNPELARRIEAFGPDAVLVFGYNYLAHYRLIFSGLARRVPLLFRGDSHRLVTRGSRHEEALIDKSAVRGAWSVVRGLKERLRCAWISQVFRRFSAFLYVGQANRDYFRCHGVPDERLFFCPHCVDNARFFAQAEEASRQAGEWRRELGIAPSRKTILFAGKFEAKKRPRDLVAAFKQAALKDATLLLVGSGELEAALRSDAAGHPDIVFAPFQNQSLMPRTYAVADLFVLPSYGRDETWGLAVNEAMCLGRPIIVSDHVGCAQDLVHPQRNGLVFPAGDVPALAEALRQALAEPHRLRAWGEQSREIIKGYSYEQATKGLLAALECVGQKQRLGKKKAEMEQNDL
jgi:glycosyltransferase involved in cell wall biosynthesis